MPVNYAPLKILWATLPAGNTTAQNLAVIGGMTVAGPNIDVPVSKVAAYLFSNLKIAALKSYVAAPPSGSNPETVEIANLLAMIAGNQAPFPSFGTSALTSYSSLQEMLALLAADANTGIASADVTALMAMAQTSIPWWQANGFPAPISVMDLEAEGCGLIAPGSY